MLDFDSLPPVGANTPNAAAERRLARDIFEHAVLLSIKQGDKDGFQKSISQLRPYYTGYEYALILCLFSQYFSAAESETKYTIIGKKRGFQNILQIGNGVIMYFNN